MDDEDITPITPDDKARLDEFVDTTPPSLSVIGDWLHETAHQQARNPEFDPTYRIKWAISYLQKHLG